MYYESNHYASLWSKYRPVILQLMMAAGNEPQQYKLSAHEFKAIGQREKTGFSFTLEVSDGKAVNNIKGSKCCTRSSACIAAITKSLPAYERRCV